MECFLYSALLVIMYTQSAFFTYRQNETSHIYPFPSIHTFIALTLYTLAHTFIH